jgi:surface protein
MSSRFNQDIRRWNVSNVTSMRYMFRGDWIFNHNLAAWDVSRVQNMEQMFAECHAFNQDLRKWDVSSVTKRHFFCFGASSFEKDKHEPKFLHQTPPPTNVVVFNTKS